VGLPRRVRPALVVSGCGGGGRRTEPRRSESAAMTWRIGGGGRFPAKAGRWARPAEIDGPRVSNESARHGAEPVAISVDFVLLRRKIRRTGREQAAGVWVVEEGPGTPAELPVQSQGGEPARAGGQTNYVNTWALGPLKARRVAHVHVEGRAGEGGPPTPCHLRVAAGTGGQRPRPVLRGGRSGEQEPHRRGYRACPADLRT